MIFKAVMDIKLQWQATNLRPRTLHTASLQSHITRWRQPPELFLECNVDAVLFPELGHVGYGCILRKYLGTVLGAIHGSFPEIQNLTIAEVWEREALS